MKPKIAKVLVLDALMMAVWRRKPMQEVIVHSDQSSQYGSDNWKRFCYANKLLPSMSCRGNCWANAVAESFFSSLKKERIRKRIYKKHRSFLVRPEQLNFSNYNSIVRPPR
jgi:putative transposase